MKKYKVEIMVNGELDLSAELEYNKILVLLNVMQDLMNEESEGDSDVYNSNQTEK